MSKALAVAAPPAFITCAWNEVQELSLDRPLTTVATALFFSALGLTMIGSAPFIAGTIPLSFFGTMSIGAASPFAIALVNNYRHLPFAFTPLSHMLSQAAFTPKSCQGGILYYEGDVPVLRITASTPLQAGVAQGYLTGQNIHDIWKRYIQVVIPFHGRSPNAYENLKRAASSLTIPQQYREEMEGIVEGYNRWLKEYKHENGLTHCGQPLTYQDLLVWHAMVDLVKSEGNNASLSSSVVVSHEKGEELQVGRNLDMPSLSLLGRQFLLIRREIRGQQRSAIVTLPGTVGSFTGMNQHGVFAASNEAGSSFRAKGIPYSLLQRHVLDTSHSANAAKHHIANISQPASSHLLTIADPKTAFVIQFGSTRTERDLPAKSHLIATNHFINRNGVHLPEGTNPDLSEWRRRLIESDLSALSFLPANRRIRATLKKVQNIDTTQTILFHPAKRELSLGLANSYAASGKLTTLTYRQLFG